MAFDRGRPPFQSGAVRLRLVLPWLGFAVIALLTLVTSRAPSLEADPAVRAILVEDARRANLEPVNTSATLARPAPPRIEVTAIEIRQQLVNRLIGNRGYTATVRYSVEGRPLCDRFTLKWSEERKGWTSRGFTTRGCTDWFARP